MLKSKIELIVPPFSDEDKPNGSAIVRDVTQKFEVWFGKAEAYKKECQHIESTEGKKVYEFIIWSFCTTAQLTQYILAVKKLAEEVGKQLGLDGIMIVVNHNYYVIYL